MKTIVIILIIIAVLFVLTFAAYITNADGKMAEKIYNSFIKMHDEREVEEKI
ncbi:MAG: hypothetical protein N4A63_09020 [Vallitalea sp.]|jgi:uncharacterized protein YxeA|nr:hypothetical protein [Vallitalea sp.]